MNKQKPCVIWFTGYSGAGKSSLALEVEKLLIQQGQQTSSLDGDIVRNGLCQDLSFSKQDREENIRRIGYVAHQMVDAGLIVLCAFISPFRDGRDKVRALFKEGEFIEVFVDTPLDICEQRDVKGLYKKARSGKITEFTGIDSPYEKPLAPEVHIKNVSGHDIEESAQLVMNYLSNKT
ncbi:MAG: adenylyl-sulfate kinase [Oleispira sp.]|nr:adenylyl-sulfate kinase [Oleispira sp.]MBL4879945.1 adenylyl-sulfate kinase [Oleispira sp.]